MNLKNAVTRVYKADSACHAASWLTKKGSLTKKLESHTKGNVTVKLVSQKVSPISAYESKLLRLSAKRWAWIREVELRINNEPWVFARTVVYPLTKQIPFLFKALGEKPLGRLIYSDPKLHESEPSLRIYTKRSKIWPHISRYYPSQDEAIGRHRKFSMGQSQILVHEIILPTAKLS